MRNLHPASVCNNPYAEILQVYQYLLANDAKVVACWRARIYYYSSASIFKTTYAPLKEWYLANKEARRRSLLKLRDEDDLYDNLSECMFDFIKAKAQPFPHATKSKLDFWNVPAWKRAMVHVFGLRHTLDEHCTKQWKHFTHESWKFFKTAFRRYLRKDADIFAECTSLSLLPESQDDDERTRKRKAKAARRLTIFAPSPEKKKKKITKIAIVISSDEEGT